MYNVSKLKPVLTGVADSNFNISKAPVPDNVVCTLNGYFEAQADGYYLFGIETDGRANLYIGDKMVIDVIHGESVVVPLKKGFYSLSLNYLHQHGEKKLNLFYETPAALDSDRAGPVPLSILYH